MQIVIEIPDRQYELLQRVAKTKRGVENLSEYGELILNGTPLPKGHGRLVDADELYDGFIDGTEGYDCQTWNRIEIGDIIEDAPTIIEADNESEE